MTAYFIKRIGIGLVSLFMLATVVFFLTRLMPGSPFQTGNVSENVVEAVEEEYGLDRPVLEQYAGYMLGLLKGDLGISYREQGVAVADVLKRAAPMTAWLGVLSVLTAALLGTAAGSLSAISRSRAVRGAVSAGTLLGMGIPNFAAALLLLLVFGVKLKWFPVTGLYTPLHYVLPVISLSVYPACVVTKLVNRSVKEELGREYVLLARAKGLPFRKIFFRHVLKNAWIPALNYIGPMAAFLMTGSFVVESVFNIPGLGREFVSSITNRDYTMIMGLTIFMGSVVIIITLLTDLLCGCLDARVRRAYTGKE